MTNKIKFQNLKSVVISGIVWFCIQEVGFAEGLAEKLSVSLGTYGLGTRINLNPEIRAELRYSLDSDLHILSGRGYYSLKMGTATVFLPFVGVEYGTIDFNTAYGSGKGTLLNAFIGSELFVNKQLSIEIDLGYGIITLSALGSAVSGPEIISGIGINLYLSKKETQKLIIKKTTSYIYVKVVDINGNKIAKTTIKISQGENIIKKDFSDDNGEYITEELPLGIYTVKVWKEGYVAEEKEVNLSCDKPVEVVIFLKKISRTVQIIKETEKSSDKNNQLSANIVRPLTETQSGKQTIQTSGKIGKGIFIKVMNVRSNPIAGATIEILQGNQVFKKVLTDGNGEYVTEELPPGTYLVKVWKTRYFTDTKEVTVSGTVEVRFQLKGRGN